MVTQQKIFETNSTNSKQVLILLNKTSHLFSVKRQLHFLSVVGGKTIMETPQTKTLGHFCYALVHHFRI